MSSLFARNTKSLVRELGRKGELVPVDSLNSAQRLHLFCLLRKKHRRPLWPWDTPLIPTDLSLLDVLEPGGPFPEVNRSSPIHIWEKVAGGVSGAVNLSTGLQGQLTGSSGASCVSALAVQTLWVSPRTWEMLVEKRKLRSPRPSILRELQRWKERESLYVVTEAVESLQDTLLQNQARVQGTGQLSITGQVQKMGEKELVATWISIQLPHPVCLHLSISTVQGQSHMATEKMVSIPQGSVLAYRVLQLVVEEDSWGIAFSQGPGQEPDFQGLQGQVGDQLQDLAELPPKLRDTLLAAFQELLQDRQTLQELEDTLEQAVDTGLLEHLEGPGGFILSILQDSTGNIPSSRGRAILYILGALAALSDPQHCLLAQSLERQILSQELELVSSILELNFNQMEEATCPLPENVLWGLQDEDVVLALRLVQSCGLELGEPGCRLSWDPTVLPQLSALYGCLTGLQLLADPSPGLSRTVPEERC